MLYFMKVISTSLLLFIILSQALGNSEPALKVPTVITNCASDFADRCKLQCSDGNYLIDEKGCPVCSCVSNNGKQLSSCPEIKCRANCGDGGYQLDENGCRTCKCVKKENVQCSRFMCRMFCQHGFKRDENGCEYCACNDSPQPCPNLGCTNICENGYQKDFSGCATCDCNEPRFKPDDKCAPVECAMTCLHGFQIDQSGCKQCACNRCPLNTCRMYCTYGFRRNEDGCEICECDWTPVSEKIKCDERNPCPEQRICNTKVKLCEKVDPEDINWFLYDFEVPSDIFSDQKFVQTFKNGFIGNIAKKYNLEKTQIKVSAVERHGLTSFQIMPFFSDNSEEFQQKMDQIDNDLNSHEFRSVLPAVVHVIDNNDDASSSTTLLGRFCAKTRNFLHTSARSISFVLIFLLLIIGFVILVMRLNARRHRFNNSSRTDSKLPIYDSAYHPAPTEDDHYHSVSAHDATIEKNSLKGKQVNV